MQGGGRYEWWMAGRGPGIMRENQVPLVGGAVVAASDLALLGPTPHPREGVRRAWRLMSWCATPFVHEGAVGPDDDAGSIAFPAG